MNAKDIRRLEAAASIDTAATMVQVCRTNLKRGDHLTPDYKTHVLDAEACVSKLRRIAANIRNEIGKP